YFLKIGVPDWQHLVSFDQDDAFGDAGFNDLNTAYTSLKGGVPSGSSIARFRYVRDDPTSVPAQVNAASSYIAGLLASSSGNQTFGYMRPDTYGPPRSSTTGIRDWQFAKDSQQTMLQKATRLTIYFSNVPFVGANALADRLKQAGDYQSLAGPKGYGEGVLV